MKKNLFLNIIIMFLLIIPLSIKALEYPDLYSEKALVYDLTDDKILYSIKDEERVSIASLTKVMTTLVSIENIHNLEEKVMITEDILSTVRWDASVAGLKAGDRVTYKDLLYASILPSGADATNALAILTSGSISNFVDKMNAKAKELDLNDTHYVNVTGLDAEGHYSTANDLLKLLKYSLNNELFKTIYTTKTYTLTNGLKVESTVNKYNRTLNVDTSKIIGSKTGFTKDAGLCISVYFKIEDHDMLLITLGADSTKGEKYNLIDAINLINFVDKNYGYQQIVSENYVVENLPVLYSNIDNYKVEIKEDISLFLDNGYNKGNVKIIYDGLESLSFKNKKDENIGSIKLYYEDKLLKETEVVLEEDINMNLLKIIYNNKYLIIMLLFVIVLILFLIKHKKKRRKRKVKKY